VRSFVCRQKKPIAFRFHGLRKSRESSIFLGSFFLCKSKRKGFDLLIVSTAPLLGSPLGDVRKPCLVQSFQRS
jgi:hypothetical protein